MFVKDQLTDSNYLQAIFFAVAAALVLVATAGLALIDSGLSRKSDMLDIWISKLVAGAVCAGGFALVGYGVWEWQFESAYHVPDAFRTAIDTWWLGGAGMTHFAQDLDPKLIPGADVYQVFGGFFLVFAFFFGALLHSAGAGRLRPASLIPLSFVSGAVMFPLISWLFWGSASPLTNRGLSDYVGVYSVYLFIGAFSVILSWRLGKRAPIRPADLGEPWQLGLGVFLLMFALPVVVLGSGYLTPGAGYFGISMTSSGFGIVLLNTLFAFIGGIVSGAVISYARRDPSWVLYGPIAGYVSCGAVLDIAKPWEVLLLSHGRPGRGLDNAPGADPAGSRRPEDRAARAGARYFCRAHLGLRRLAHPDRRLLRRRPRFRVAARAHQPGPADRRRRPVDRLRRGVRPAVHRSGRLYQDAKAERRRAGARR